MDYVNHGTMGFCIGLAMGRSLPECILLAMVGILPDAVGKLEKVYTKNPDAWKWYNAMHSIGLLLGLGIFMLVWEVLALAFSEFRTDMTLLIGFTYFIHLLFDAFLHNDGQRWWKWKERMWVEVATWIALITFLVMHYGR